MRAVTVYRVDFDSNTGYRTRHPIGSVAVRIVIDVSQARQAGADQGLCGGVVPKTALLGE